MAFLAPIVGTGLRAVAGRVIGSRIAPMLANVGSKAASSASSRLGQFGLGKTATSLGHISNDLSVASASGEAAKFGAQYGMQAGLNAPMGGGSQKQNFNQGIDIQSMYGASGS